jgi:molybdate transport repressor ModE-like protein
MEIAQIRYFLALCDEGSFTRAARHCGVAQPSLTRAIGNLERELGTMLFERNPGGTTLTSNGRRIAPYFKAIWYCMSEVKHNRWRRANCKPTEEILGKFGIAPAMIDSSSPYSEQ